MNSHKLLLLLVAILLPQVFLLSARHHETLHASRQEYGDTTSLLNTTTQELRQAYDLLDILKRRSQEIATKNTPALATQTRLPKDLDALRDRMIKQPLITVLSATPFSDPDKHTADCKTAISALESYSQTIQSSLAATPQATPADFTNLTKTYDLGIAKTEATPTPAQKPVTATPPAATPALPIVAPQASPATTSSTSPELITAPTASLPTPPPVPPLPEPAKTLPTAPAPQITPAPELPKITPDAAQLMPSLVAAEAKTTTTTPAAVIPDVFAAHEKNESKPSDGSTRKAI